MNRLTLNVILVLLLFVLQSQYPGPDGNDYQNECIATEPFNVDGTAESWFNDPNNDCISNDWIIIFTYPDGSTTFFTPSDWINSNPESNGYYNFNEPFWDCCGNTFSSGGDGGAQDITCSCDWDYDPATSFLIIDCPDDC